jgi:hypothetical protein
MIKSIYLSSNFSNQTRKDSNHYAKCISGTLFNCPTWQEYIKSLLPLTTPAIKSEREAHTDIVVDPGEKFEQGCAFH